MKKIFYTLTYLASVFFLFTSCETIIHPELEKVENIVAVDAWINNKPGDQIITLTTTQSYFDNSQLQGVSSAVVQVQNITSGKIYSFNEATGGKGAYIWKPAQLSDRIGQPGDEFRLFIQAKGESYEAFSNMGRVPLIDSVTFTFQEENSFQPAAYIAEFWATDPEGRGDTYWIRATKNDTLLNKPSEINLAFDAGFSNGGNFDGITFIPPIRSDINPYDEDANKKPLSPYDPGDSVYVEINSISLSAFNHLQQVITETDRNGGFGELFSAPLANVSTNISNTKEGGKKAVGFFNVAAVSGGGKKLVIKK